MPPPTSYTYLRDRIAQLKMEAEALNKKSLPTQVFLSPVEQYCQKIGSWINALPTSQQDRKYAINEVITLAGLKGKYEELPAQADVAEALRKAGFIQVRSWKKIDRSKRYWMYKHQTISYCGT